MVMGDDQSSTGDDAHSVPAKEHIKRAARAGQNRVAIIGAGLSGLACAQTLRDHNVAVTVFDKGRAPGGRLSSRRVTLPSRDELSFDLGAQYFTVRDPGFARWVHSWQEGGVCEPWLGRVVAVDEITSTMSDTLPMMRWVGTPHMSALARHMARDLAVCCSRRVDLIERRAEGLVLLGEVGETRTTLTPARGVSQSVLGEFDTVLVALPAPQASALLQPLCPALAAAAQRTVFTPCFAAGVAPREGAGPVTDLPFDAAFIGRDSEQSDAALAWVARDTSKPSRGTAERWTLHASTRLSLALLDEPAERVAEILASEFARLFGVPEPEVMTARRWLYARAAAPSAEGAWLDENAGVGVCGDWLAGGRVEGAILSGVALAGRVLESWGR